VSGTGEVHVYGSAIRANATCSTQAGTTLKVVKAESGGIVHIHGTGIDAVSEAPNDIRVLLAAAGGEIHANVSAYNLSNVAGSVIRVSGAGHVHAPYVWEHIPDATKVPGFASAHGADTTTLSVATDNNHPHTVVYSKSCPSGTPWYDQVDKVCR
jgi:large exoprotein involved in heme utilization and adhesion